MNQREALLILFEATADSPDTTAMRRARRWAEKRLETLRVRYARMNSKRLWEEFWTHRKHCDLCRNCKYCDVGRPIADAYKAAARNLETKQ